MMGSSESPREAGVLTADALKPKTFTRVGFWNVRTLNQSGKLAQATKEFDTYNLDMLGMSEVRWKGYDRRHLASGHLFLYSGRNDRHEEGVGLLISRKLSKALIGWTPLGPRLLKARFNSKFIKLTVVVCYAPHNQRDADEKDDFYQQLQAAVETVPAHDMLLVLGDLNARTGSDNKGKERYMGKHGMGDLNDNGERLIGICEQNELTIGGTLFPHKNIHKVTWTSPDGKTKEQLDHILINRKWRGSLQDVRVYRGADIFSDHGLLIGKIKLKLRKTRRGQERGRIIDSGALKDEGTKIKYRLELQNRFKKLEGKEDLNIEDINQVYIETGERILGFKKRKRKVWMKKDTWDKIEERKTIKGKIDSTRSERVKAQLKQNYSDLDKEIKGLTKKDKIDYVEELASEAEEAARRQDLRTLYKITKSLNGNVRSGNCPIRDEGDKIITDDSEEVSRWQNHFQSILNRPSPDEEADIPEAEVDLDINADPPTEEEIISSIKAMKSGKAGGKDGVTADMLKTELSRAPKLLLTIFSSIWNSEISPTSWETGLIVKLPKKGDLSYCGNWRGITLLSLTSKVFSRIIFKRLLNTVKEHLRPEQAGFLPGRSCAEHIFILRQILEQSNEWNDTVYANFVDFEKAFDSLHRNSLWKILRHYGIPSKITNIIKMLYCNFSAQVICGNELTETFQVKTGVKQGCILSPFLFILGINWVMNKATMVGSHGLRWTLASTLEDLDFADDIVLLSKRQSDSQIKTSRMASAAKSIGLKVNAKKTKLLRVNANNQQPIQIYGEDIDDVQDFTYLGSKMTADGNVEIEVKVRIRKARHAFSLLRQTWKSRKLSTKTKLRIFQSNVISVLIYGAESWKTTRGLEDRLNAFQRKCLRQILGIHWPERIRNSTLYRRTSTHPITLVIKRRRWTWLGHLLRMPPLSHPRIAVRWTPDGNRGRGRPRETWRRTIEREMAEQGQTWGSLERMAGDRDRWRVLVDALCAVDETDPVDLVEDPT